MDVDLNCDLGEGCAFDDALMPLVTSVNIACGFHAGDPAAGHAALKAAARHGVQAGAHPSFPDRQHFGRRELNRTEEQIFQDCVYQVGALAGLAKAVGWPLRHIKPHGALYNLACRNDTFARPLIAAAEVFQLPLLGLPGSRLEALCQVRIPFISEGFADRRYLPDGSLTPRSSPDAFVEDPQEAFEQVRRLIKEHHVQTICVHGDNPKAVAFVQALRAALTQAGLRIKPFLLHPAK